MLLHTLLQDVADCRISGSTQIAIRAIHTDSRRVAPGDVFVAVRGTTTDGHQFIHSAISRGAVAIVAETLQTTGAITGVQTLDSRKALALMAARYYDRPAENLRLVGITGTNGKTSTAYLVHSILEAAHLPSCLLTTIEYRYGKESLPARLTTPDALELQMLLRSAAEAGAAYSVMEASSHALVQDRLFGLQFDVAVYTNLSQDHLDYHGDMDQYITAKATLFDQLTTPHSRSVVNLDDEFWEVVTGGSAGDTLSFGMTDRADIHPAEWTADMSGIRATIITPVGTLQIQSPLIGAVHMYNIMAAMGSGIALNIDPECITQGIAACTRIPGRMERVDSPRPFAVFVDFAHTPDAVMQTLTSVRNLSHRRIITVIGCGGDRDRGKRHPMGEIASRLSNVAIFTADNPRSESPEDIISMMLEGVANRDTVHREPDRQTAIAWAIQQAQPQDVVLILGKGHETTQTIGSDIFEFDDRKIADALLNA